jgi:hypothetical protein
MLLLFVNNHGYIYVVLGGLPDSSQKYESYQHETSLPGCVQLVHDLHEREDEKEGESAYNMTIFWDVTSNYSKISADMSKDRSAFILGVVQPEGEVNADTRNVGVYYQLTLRYKPEVLNVHSYRCEALESRKSVVVKGYSA